MIKNIRYFGVVSFLFLLLICQSQLYGQTTLDEIINDMILPHEGLPHGVPLSYDWSQKPRKGAPEPGEGWSAAIAWGQVYEWAEGSTETNARIQIKDLEMYYLSKTDHQWHLLQNAKRVSGANYVEDFAGDVSKPADIRVESDGSISTTCGDGYNFHFWPAAGRVTIPVNDVAGCFSTVKARIILDDPEGKDDRDQAKYLMSVGGDWWESLTAQWDNWTTNWDIGIGRFRFITEEWKSFNMYSVPEDTIRNNPPPFTLRVNTPVNQKISEQSNNLLDVISNPFSGKTEILFNITQRGKASIRVYDMSGRMLKLLAEDNYQKGNYKIEWDASCYPVGVYILHYTSNQGHKTTRFLNAR